MTLCIVGFDDLVTSFVATIATGWSDPCRVGLSPTEKPRLHAAHHAVATAPAQRLGLHSLTQPSRISLPRKGYRVGLRIVLFEVCSAFTRVTACTLAPSPYIVTR